MWGEILCVDWKWHFEKSDFFIRENGRSEVFLINWLHCTDSSKACHSRPFVPADVPISQSLRTNPLCQALLGAADLWVTEEEISAPVGRPVQSTEMVTRAVEEQGGMLSGGTAGGGGGVTGGGAWAAWGGDFLAEGELPGVWGGGRPTGAHSALALGMARVRFCPTRAGCTC